MISVTSTIQWLVNLIPWRDRSCRCGRCGSRRAENVSSASSRPIYRCEKHSRLIRTEFGDYRIPE